MSKTVDERVVSMQFDNSQFERNVSTSMSTLDKLKQSLNLNGAAKGLDSINDSAKRFDLSTLGNGVEAVKAKFSALEVMGITALANITNSAVNAGKRLASAFTIEPIKTGFQEYETQINAVQTILSNTRSKGTTLDDVNNALDQLNKYADMTIYNFTEMTRNIGTFTEAGVDLDTSVSAIKGIANLAAVSGSNSQQASTAMYQLSQALAAGTVKLQDWNSVVNAGMGGQVFQDALKETARVHGIAIDDMITKEGSFRETLQNGWLSSEILTETLSKFTGDLTEEQLKSMGYTKEQAKEILALGEDANNAATKVKTFTQLMDTLKEAAQSGWTQTWEILVGDFEEAKSLWTTVSDVFSDMINKSAEARNTMLEGWKDGGGRTMAIDAIKNAFEGLINIITPIKEAFREVFPPTTSAQLLKLTEGIKNLSEKFKDFTEKNADKIKSTFKGLFSVIGIGVDFFKALGSGLIKLVSNFTGLSGGILNATSSIGDWLSGLRKIIKETDLFAKAINGIVNFLQNGIDKIKEFGSLLKENFIMSGFDGFLEIMKSIWDLMTKIGGKISEFGSEIGATLSNAFKSGDIASGLDIVNGGLTAGLLLTLKKAIKGIADSFGNAGGLLDNVKDVLDGVKDSLKSFQQDIQAKTLLKIAAAVGILALSITVIASINPERLASSLTAISILFGELIGSLAIITKLDGLKGVVKATAALASMSISVLILAGALKLISSIKPDELVTGLFGITVLLGELVAVSLIMSKTGVKMTKGSTGLILLAVAIKILASACKDFSTMNWEEIGKGLSGVTVILGELVIASVIMYKTGSKMIKGSVGLILLASAMKILASTCMDFSSMSWEEIIKSLTSVTVLLGELVITSILLNKFCGGGKMLAVGVGLIAITAALKIMSSAFENFASMDLNSIGHGLLAMGVALGELVLACVLLNKFCGGGKLIAIGIGLIAVSTAVTILASALETMGGMSWSGVAKGLVALGGSMVILAIGLNVMNGTLAGSAALLVASASLSVLSSVLQTFGDMGWGEIGKGLLTLAGAFAIIGVAGVLLTPLVPTLLGLGAAILLVGVGAAACGAGMMLIASAFTALALAGATGATAIVSALTIIITGIVGLIPAVVQKIGEAIVIFCQAIIAAAPAIGEAIKVIVLTMIDVLVSCVPAIIEAGLVLLISLLTGIRDNIKQVVEIGFDIITNLIRGIAEKIPELATAGADIAISFIDGIATAIDEKHEKMKEAMLHLCEAILDAVKDFFGINSPSKVFEEIGGYLIDGLKNGITGKSEGAISTMKNISSRLLESIGNKLNSAKTKGSELISNLKSGIESKGSSVKNAVQSSVSKAISIVGSKAGEMISKGKILMDNLKGGISSGASTVTSSVKTVVTAAANALKGYTTSFTSAGKNLIDGFKNGIKYKAQSVIDSVKSVAKNAIDAAKRLLKIKSPSRVFMEIGKFTDLGFAKGIDMYAKNVYSSTEDLANGSIRGMSRAISRIGDSFDSNVDVNPTIRPVLDLSDVSSGANDINSMLSSTQSVGVMSNIGAISSMMSERQNGTTNDDVVSAIDKLGRNLKDLPRNNYTVNGITYDDGSAVAGTIESLIHATKIERRI